VHRRVVTHIAVFAVGLAGGVGAVAVAADTNVHKAATETDVVKQLRKTNAKLDVLNRSLGGHADKPGKPSVRVLLEQICEASGSLESCGRTP
jgi:hypothetical protein